MLVNSFGGIYRISKKNFQRFLEDSYRGKETELNQYGGKFIGYVDVNITDLNCERILDELRGMLGWKRLSKTHHYITKDGEFKLNIFKTSVGWDCDIIHEDHIDENYGFKEDSKLYRDQSELLRELTEEFGPLTKLGESNERS